MKIKLLALCIFAIIANSAKAYTISGRVTDGKEPLIGAVVTRGGTEGDAAYAVTDIDGRYTIESEPGDFVFLTVSYVNYYSEIKTVTGQVLDFEMEKCPTVPVDFFNDIITNSKILADMMGGQIRYMGLPGFKYCKIYVSDDTLVFAIVVDRDVSSYVSSIENFGDTTIKGYLDQLKNERNLNTFLGQMLDSGMKWCFGLYNSTTGKWIQYKTYDAKQLKRLS